MTRILSELLGAREPSFRQGLQQLERASGGAAQDIRLTTEILHGTHDKLRQLQLDPQDTTGRELYQALMQRVKEDNKVFEDLLGAKAQDGQLTKSVERFIKSLHWSKEVFAMRTTTAKRLLRKHPPKRAMKQLGYRSVESMLKHEPVALIFTAACLVETVSWHRLMTTAYKKLSPSDFECRPVQLLAPSNARWEALARAYVMSARQNIIGLREMGTVVLLPMPSMRLEAAPLAVTIMALQAINELATASTYLKMHQVRPDFGSIVANISRNEPVTSAQIAGSALPWRVVHRYFARNPEAYNPNLFEPHVHPADLSWLSADNVLAELHPRLGFWQGSGHLGMIASKHHTVSLNVMDTVLSFCNTLPYERRIVRYLRDHIWNELLLRYMRQSGIESAVHEQLGNELVERSLAS